MTEKEVFTFKFNASGDFISIEVDGKLMQTIYTPLKPPSGGLKAFFDLGQICVFEGNPSTLWCHRHPDGTLH